MEEGASTRSGYVGIERWVGGRVDISADRGGLLRSCVRTQGCTWMEEHMWARSIVRN